jgi:chaperone modulatory protein CbpM
MTRYALVRRAHARGLPVDDFAAAAGLHPDLVHRLVTLGLLDGDRGAGDVLVMPATELPRAARIARLRIGLGLNLTAVGLVLDLLDRIDELEAALRTRPYGIWR